MQIKPVFWVDTTPGFLSSRPVMQLFCPECQKRYDDPVLVACPDDGSKLLAVSGQEPDPLLGATLDDRFRIDGLLGEGGMGAVYRGTQLSVNREVAIKVLRRELTRDQMALERFYREAKIICDLTHPNVVRLYDFGQDRERGLVYLTMELVRGISMADVLRKGRLRVATALDLVYQICGALTEPHARGVIHRDLKPDNLILVPVSDGTLQAKVLDFGIARALQQRTQITETGMVCGTPAYMAPEQAQNSPMDSRTDLYALGVILYEMLVGTAPFDGENSLQLMIQHIQQRHRPLGEYLPPSVLPEDIEQLVDRMMAKSPDERPKSAREVRDAIDTLRRRYDLEPQRIDPALELDALVDALVMRPMPRPDDPQVHETGLLVRESGLRLAAPANGRPAGDDGDSIAHAHTLPFDASTPRPTTSPEKDTPSSEPKDQPSPVTARDSRDPSSPGPESPLQLEASAYHIASHQQGVQTGQHTQAQTSKLWLVLVLAMVLVLAAGSAVAWLMLSDRSLSDFARAIAQPGQPEDSSGVILPSDSENPTPDRSPLKNPSAGNHAAPQATPPSDFDESSAGTTQPMPGTRPPKTDDSKATDQAELPPETASVKVNTQETASPRDSTTTDSSPKSTKSRVSPSKPSDGGDSSSPSNSAVKSPSSEERKPSPKPSRTFDITKGQHPDHRSLEDLVGD